MAFIGYRFDRAHSVLRGQPIVLVQNGELIEPNLKRERIRPEEIAEQARMQQINSIDQIRWAVLEASGDISVAHLHRRSTQGSGVAPFNAPGTR